MTRSIKYKAKAVRYVNLYECKNGRYYEINTEISQSQNILSVVKLQVECNGTCYKGGFMPITSSQ